MGAYWEVLGGLGPLLGSLGLSLDCLEGLWGRLEGISGYSRRLLGLLGRVLTASCLVDALCGFCLWFYV